MTPISFSHPAWIEINLQQFKRNIVAIRQHIGKRLLCFPVKANAYGHGLIPMSQTAVAAGVDYLGVSCLQEGAILREAGINTPILVMGAIHEAQITELLHHQLELTIASLYKAKLVAKKCLELQQKCRVHVEIDTGMHRTGVRCQTALDLLNYLKETTCFEIVGLYSHLATADDPNSEFAHKQIREFQHFADQYAEKTWICHLANSAGVCYFQHSLMDMVRPGLLPLGYFPSQQQEPLANIKPFFAVKAKVAYFKVLGPNEGISYGHTYKTQQQTRIVTIPLGYGDGYRRDLSNCGEVLIHGQRYPIAGTICMDQFMVDIGQNEAYVGDEVTLIGTQGKEEIALNDIAHLCDTIPYEILCGFNDRLPRFYLD